jgi:hypothetical protein
MLIALIFIWLFAVTSVFAAGERKTFKPLQLSTGDFHGCPPEGRGSDPYLNRRDVSCDVHAHARTRAEA